jgi:hypothetical protein
MSVRAMRGCEIVMSVIRLSLSPTCIVDRRSCAWLGKRLARADFCTAHCLSTLRILLFHVADDGLTTIVHMDVLDADKLLAAIA